MTARVPDHASLPVEQLRVTPPRPAWSGGPEEFWTCDDGAERLSITEFEEAVIEHLEGWSEKSGPEFEAFLRRIAPLTVYGYSRAEVTDAILEHQAESMVEHLVEQLNEDEWGDPDGLHDVLRVDGQDVLTEKVLAALKEVRGHIIPWHCEVTRKVVLEADELVALVRELSPEWFEAEP